MLELLLSAMAVAGYRGGYGQRAGRAGLRKAATAIAIRTWRHLRGLQSVTRGQRTCQAERGRPSHAPDKRCESLHSENMMGESRGVSLEVRCSFQ